MNTEAQQVQLVPTMDIYEAAYLEMKGVPAILGKSGTQVIFQFPAMAHTYETLREYHTNPSHPVVDFVKHIRRLRARMIEARGA